MVQKVKKPYPPPPSLRSLPSVALRECDPQRVQNDIESFF